MTAYAEVGTRVEAHDFTSLSAPAPIVEVRDLRKVFPGKDKRPLLKRLLGRGEAPKPFEVVSLALPLTYGYDAARGLLLGARTLLPLPTEVAILAAFMAIMVALGAYVFARVERRCRQLGTLGMH